MAVVFRHFQTPPDIFEQALIVLQARHPRSIDKLRRLLYLWHCRLGHPHPARFHTMIKQAKFPMLERVTRSDLEAYLDCAICKAAKSKEQPHRNLGTTMDASPLEHFAVDNKILPQPMSYGKITAITVIVCLVTKRGFIYPLQEKGDEIHALDRHRQAIVS